MGIEKLVVAVVIEGETPVLAEKGMVDVLDVLDILDMLETLTSLCERERESGEGDSSPSLIFDKVSSDKIDRRVFCPLSILLADAEEEDEEEDDKRRRCREEEEEETKESFLCLGKRLNVDDFSIIEGKLG